MELSTALLTGFFFWLLVFHWYRRASARRREEAGKLLFRAATAIPAWRRHRWAWVASGYLLVCLVPQIIVLGIGREVPHLPPPQPALGIAVGFFLVLLLAVPLGRTDIAMEVRETGVLCGTSRQHLWLGRLEFTAWNAIADCKWVGTPTAFQVRPFLGILRIAEDAIRPDQRPAVTAALGQFVPVYGCDGALLTRPEKPNETPTLPPADRRSGRQPFQFDLQSLLILTVAVACAASCYGIRYRRLKPQWDALAKLEAFGPSIRYINDRLWMLDFWNCPKGLADDDLALLEPLVDVENLWLYGPGITDAGLKHLKGLKGVRAIYLVDTRVTAKGREELQRALPNTKVSRTVSVPSAPAGGGAVTAPPGAKAGDKEQ